MSVQTYSQDIIAPGSHLESDRVLGTSLATGTSLTYDVETSHTNWIVVQGDLAGAAVSGDLIITVQPYSEDGTTLETATPITADSGHTSGPTLAGGRTYFWGRYDVTGIGRVRLIWTNNNAGTKVLTRASWRTESIAGR